MVTFAYDAAGLQSSRIDARSNRTTYLYDAAEQPTGRVYPDGTRATWVYDAAGNMILQHDWTGRYTRTYDVMNRVTGALYPFNKRITFAYDSRGLRDHMIDTEAGRTTYAYDAAERYRIITDPDGGVYTFTDDAAGQRVKEELANGTVASMIYDGAGQTTRVANLKSDASVISQFDYRYDDAGNRVGVTEDNGDRVTWTYDDTNQLLSEHRDGANAYATTFAYDPVGNRLVKDHDSARTTSVYDAANQLKYSEDVSGRTTYSYDNDGNERVIETPTNQLTTTAWSFENQPTAVELPSNIHTSIYNSDQWRVAKVDEAGDVTSLVWDDQNYIAEYDALAQPQVKYNYEPEQYGNLLSQDQTDGIFYHHYDALGSTRELSDSAEVQTDTWLYGAYGETEARSGTTVNPYQWIGKVGYYNDEEIDQHAVRRRNLRAGRFTSRDTVEDDVNPYRYSRNAPVQAVDPSGNEVIKVDGGRVYWQAEQNDTWGIDDNVGHRFFLGWLMPSGFVRLTKFYKANGTIVKLSRIEAAAADFFNNYSAWDGKTDRDAHARKIRQAIAEYRSEKVRAYIAADDKRWLEGRLKREAADRAASGTPSDYRFLRTQLFDPTFSERCKAYSNAAKQFVTGTVVVGGPTAVSGLAGGVKPIPRPTRLPTPTPVPGPKPPAPNRRNARSVPSPQRTNANAGAANPQKGPAFHATTSPQAAQGVLSGIDPKFFSPDARFGKAFYVAESPGTALAELAHHGATPTHGIRFSIDASKLKVLDFTDANVAKTWGYHGGTASSATQAIGAKAKAQGFNAIRYKSLRGPGNNLAILDNFNDILSPKMVSPAQ